MARRDADRMGDEGSFTIASMHVDCGHQRLDVIQTGRTHRENYAICRKLADTPWERGNAVTSERQDEKGCDTLARSLGRGTAYRGFKADMRRGEGYLSVRQVEASLSRRTRGTGRTAMLNVWERIR